VIPPVALDGIFIAIGYLSGSLPMGVIVARLTGARDPRTVGSGRTGGTNALRAMGLWRAALVAALDLLKGFVPVAVASLVGASDLGVAVTGVACVTGAARSIFLRFHGGRGVATGIGATLWLAPLAVPLALPFFFGPIILTRYVSLGSLIGTLGGTLIIGVLVLLGYNVWPHFLFAALGTAVVWVAHYDNIQRLLRGEERRFDPLARGDG
jgi:glycerol-3-phosphate acyltransferase PlsY